MCSNVQRKKLGSRLTSEGSFRVANELKSHFMILEKWRGEAPEWPQTENKWLQVHRTFFSLVFQLLHSQNWNSELISKWAKGGPTEFMFEPSMHRPGNSGRPKGSLRVLGTPSCMRDIRSSKYNKDTTSSHPPPPVDHQQKGPPPSFVLVLLGASCC